MQEDRNVRGHPARTAYTCVAYFVGQGRECFFAAGFSSLALHGSALSFAHTTCFAQACQPTAYLSSGDVFQNLALSACSPYTIISSYLLIKRKARWKNNSIALLYISCCLLYWGSLKYQLSLEAANFAARAASTLSFPLRLATRLAK